MRDKYKESYEKLKSRLKNESDRSRNEFQHKLALENNELLMKMKMKYSAANNELELSNQRVRSLEAAYQGELSKINNEVAKLKN